MTNNTTLNDLKQKEREARKNLILDAAVTLFSSNPVSKVSVRDIAKQAGVSPALIYRHFTDRDELFVESFVKQSEKIITDFRHTVTSNQHLTPERVGELFVNYLLDNEDFFQMMTHFMLDAVLKDDVLSTFNDNMRKMLKLFDRSFESEEVTVQVRLHSQALLSSLNGIVITYRNYPGRNKEEIREHIVRLARFVAVKLSQKA